MFERGEIATSAFGLLAMTPTNSILTDCYGGMQRCSSNALELLLCPQDGGGVA